MTLYGPRHFGLSFAQVPGNVFSTFTHTNCPTTARRGFTPLFAQSRERWVAAQLALWMRVPRASLSGSAAWMVGRGGPTLRMGTLWNIPSKGVTVVGEWTALFINLWHSRRTEG